MQKRETYSQATWRRARTVLTQTDPALPSAGAVPAPGSHDTATQDLHPLQVDSVRVCSTVLTSSKGLLHGPLPHQQTWQLT